MEAPEQRSEKPESTESTVREGKRPSLVPDSRYGPSLWTEELDTPKQRLSFSKVPDRPCGRWDEAEVCYSGARNVGLETEMRQLDDSSDELPEATNVRRSGNRRRAESPGCGGLLHISIQSFSNER